MGHSGDGKESRQRNPLIGGSQSSRGVSHGRPDRQVDACFGGQPESGIEALCAVEHLAGDSKKGAGAGGLDGCGPVAAVVSGAPGPGQEWQGAVHSLVPNRHRHPGESAPASGVSLVVAEPQDPPALCVLLPCLGYRPETGGGAHLSLA